MRHVLLPIMFCMLIGCWGRPTPPAPSPVSDDDQDIIDQNNQTTGIDQAEDQVAQLKARLAAAEARLGALKVAEQSRMQRRLQYTAWWVAGLALLGALGCAAAAVFLSVGRKLLITGFVAGMLLMTLALTISYLIPYLVWIGLLMAIGGVCGGVWYLYRLWALSQETSAVGVEALEELRRLGLQSPQAGLPDKALRAATRIKQEALHRQILKSLVKDVDRCLAPHKKTVKYKILTADQESSHEQD